MGGGLKVHILAGEPSGDRLGGGLMAALKTLASVEFSGVGGQDMQAAGLASRFPMSDLTVMGLGEVLPRLPLILRRIRETVADIVHRRPDVLITIDSPDFTLRVARQVRKVLPGLRVVHYVAPSVWAWRPGRAVKMARHVDHVLCLLPFEPPYMEAAGMSAEFVGHPAAARPVPSGEEIAAFRARHGLKVGQRALLLAPGSRRGEVRRLMPDFLGAIGQARAAYPDLAILCPVAETVEGDVRTALESVPPPVHLLLPEEGAEEKHLAFAAADAALCASGTVTLELAAAGTPMVAAYRTIWLTAQIVRRVIKVKTANLINLVSGWDVVPEFLQEYCSVDSLTDALVPLFNGTDAPERQQAAFDEVMAALGRGGELPDMRAARSVLNFIEKGRG